MKERTIKSNGATISYNIVKGKSPAIIFIHGCGANRTVWKEYAQVLKPYTRIALDLRGHGKSSRAKISMPLFVKDVINIIKKENIKDVILIGNSLGSIIAFKVAQTLKKQVTGIVLVSHYSSEYARWLWFLHPIFVICSVISKLFKSKRKLLFQDYWKHRDKPFWHFLFMDMRGTSFTAWSTSARVLTKTSADLRKLTVPTLILQGNFDISMKVNKVKNHSIKNKFVIFKEIGTHHHVLTTEYDYSLKLIKDFLKEVTHG